MSVLEIVVLVAYGLILFELVFLPVPSEASTYHLLVPRKSGERQNLSAAILQVQRMSPGRKLWLFFVPTSITVGAFLLPLLQIFFSDLKSYLFPLAVFEQPFFQRLAVGFISLGSAITLMSVLEIRAGQGRHCTWCGAGAALQERGIFQWSRNPGLVGNYMVFLGWFLFLPSLAMALGFGIYLWNMHRRILLEESQLEMQFGESYRAYKSRVPRYLGCYGNKKAG